MSILFELLALGKLQLKNRIVIAPMCEYSAIDGNAQDWHMIHLGSLALSGAGLLILEATAVSPEGRISPGDLGLYCDNNEQALGRVLEAIRKYSDFLWRFSSVMQGVKDRAMSLGMAVHRLCPTHREVGKL